MRSMLRYLADTEGAGRIEGQELVVFYGSMTEDGIVYKDEFDEFDADHRRPAGGARDHQSHRELEGLRRVHHRRASSGPSWPIPSAWTYYIVGPPPMIARHAEAHGPAGDPEGRRPWSRASPAIPRRSPGDAAVLRTRTQRRESTTLPRLLSSRTRHRHLCRRRRLAAAKDGQQGTLGGDALGRRGSGPLRPLPDPGGQQAGGDTRAARRGGGRATARQVRGRLPGLRSRSRLRTHRAGTGTRCAAAGLDGGLPRGIGHCDTGRRLGRLLDAVDVSRVARALAEVKPELSVSREEYVEAIARVREFIAAGDTYQVNYTVRGASISALPAAVRGPPGVRVGVRAAGGDIDPLDYFLALVVRQPVPYAAYLDLGEAQIISLSPEMFLRRDGRPPREPAHEGHPAPGSHARRGRRSGLRAGRDREGAGREPHDRRHGAKRPGPGVPGRQRPACPRSTPWSPTGPSGRW